MQKPYHIVIADDDDDDQLIIKEAIKELGSSHIHLTSVYDGIQLIDCLNKKGLFAETSGNPDLIILDINMPLSNGLEALEKIKASAKFKGIPVVMLTTLRTIEREDRSIALGAHSFFTKPNNISDYKSILQQVIDKAMLSEERISA